MVYDLIFIRLRRGIIFAFLLFLCITAQAEKLAELNELFKKPFLLLDNQQLYIWDRELLKIHIYDRKNFKKINEIGEKGQGPGQFPFINIISLGENVIYVSCYPKICLFSKNGKLLKELKVTADAGSFIPFNENFIGQGFPPTKHTDERGKILFSFFDAAFHKVKDIFLAEPRKFVRYEKNKTIVSWVNDCINAVVYNDRLYIGSTDKGFQIAVFDHAGNKLYDIIKKNEMQKITDKYKQYILDEAERDMGEVEWKRYKALYEIDFPEYFPAFANFGVDNGKIYVFTYPVIGQQEILIFDLEGNPLKRKVIPAIKPASFINQGRFAIRFGRFYYVKENEETEKWELHYEIIE